MFLALAPDYCLPRNSNMPALNSGTNDYTSSMTVDRKFTLFKPKLSHLKNRMMYLLLGH